MFEQFWQDCRGFPRLVDCLKNKLTDRNNCGNISVHIQDESSVYGEELESLFQNITSSKGNLWDEFRLWIVSGKIPEPWASRILSAYGFDLTSRESCPGALVNAVKNGCESVSQIKSEMSDVEWLRQQPKIQRFVLLYENGYFIVTDETLKRDHQENATYKLKENSRRKKIEVVARLFRSFACSSGNGEFVLPEQGELSWNDKMNDSGEFQRFWRVETEGRKENGKDLPGRKVRLKPNVDGIL